MPNMAKQKRSGTVIFDDLAFKLTPSERIVFGIIHRFSGYKLGECRLKPNRIAELAGVSRSTVYNATSRLITLGMVELVRHQKSSGAYFRALKVVKDRLDDSHRRSGEFIDALEAVEVESEQSKAAVTVADPEPQKFGDETVNALFDFWITEVQIPIKSRVRANRRAAWNMLQKHGDQAVRQAIQLAAIAKFNEFAPSVASFVDLQAKWSALHLWAEKRAQADLMAKYEAMSIEDRVRFKQNNPELAKTIAQIRRAM